MNSHEERNEMLEHKRKVASSFSIAVASLSTLYSSLRFAFTASRDECAKKWFNTVLLVFFFAFFHCFTFFFDSLFLSRYRNVCLYKNQNQTKHRKFLFLFLYFHIYQFVVVFFSHFYFKPLSNCWQPLFMHINFPFNLFERLLLIFFFSLLLCEFVWVSFCI